MFFWFLGGFSVKFPRPMECYVLPTNPVSYPRYFCSVGVPSIGAFCALGILAYCTGVTGLLAIFLGIACWRLIMYLCFLWYRSMFINPASGIGEIPQALKDRFGQALEDIRDNALNRSCLHFFFCGILSFVKIVLVFFPGYQD